MEAATITLDNRIYDTARRYARRHRTSVEQLFGRFVLTLAAEDEEKPSHDKVIKPISQLSPEVQALVGIARQKGIASSQDINASDVKEEYLLEKYGR